MEISPVYKALKLYAFGLAGFLASQTTFAQNPSLEYILKPRSAEIVLGEPYHVDYFVKNNTNHDVTLCICNIDGEIVITEIRDGKYETNVDYWHTTEKPKDSDFITIRANETAKLPGSSFDEEYFRNPGMWILQIRDTHLTANSSSGISSWEGVLESDLLRVKVNNP